MPKTAAAPASTNASGTLAHAVPNYEVKLFLDAGKVLDVEFKPTAETSKALGLKNGNQKITMLFLDGKPHAFQGQRWNVRIRKFEDIAPLELSCKRRYPVEAGDVTSALAAALPDGFHAGEADYTAQVEWGYARQTVSFTRKKELKLKGQGMNLPPVEALRDAVVKELPGKLDRWHEPGWAKKVLATAQGYGPVLGKRWAGQWQGPTLDFEVWLVKATSGPGYEPVVELSFKAKKQDEAAGFRERLLAFTRDQGWLLEQDVLKTAMILERY